MPKNKFQDVIFTILMVLVMVYAMICYNITLEMGSLTNQVFLYALPEMLFMCPIAFCLDFFLFGHLSKKKAFQIVNPMQDKPIFVILTISSITVMMMCPSMSLAATLLIKKPAPIDILAVWIETTVKNFPMAFFWQIFAAGPLVRAIFGLIFRENKEKVMKDEETFLEGGEAR